MEPDPCLIRSGQLDALRKFRNEMPVAAAGSSVPDQEYFEAVLHDDVLLARALNALEKIADEKLSKLPPSPEGPGRLHIVTLPGVSFPSWANPPIGSAEFEEYIDGKSAMDD